MNKKLKEKHLMESFNERNYGKQFLIKTFHEMIYETYFSKFNK